MARNRKTAAVLSCSTIMLSVLIAMIALMYLPLHGERTMLAIGCVLVGLIASALIYLMIGCLPDRPVARYAVCLLFVAVAVSPFVSAITHTISYSRFGLTVYGVTPVPFLDITVNKSGVLWFRPKTHLITRDEIESLLSADVEVVIIGNGWDGIVQVADDAMELQSQVEIKVLRTPDAFALYNSLIAQGRKVVLLAHSTC